ncbi:MAG: hypothetical protein MJZ50_09080 [Treponema sp.]|nr:hypothetical protein [Treponema sp.]
MNYFDSDFNISFKAAVFDGTTKSILKESREFSGSLLDQYKKALEFISSKAPESISRQCIAEALANAFAHRDYSINGSSIASIFDDRIEFMSLGGLAGSLTLPDILNGACICRNPEISAEFHRVKIMNNLGSGIQKIQSEYDDCSDFCRPQFSVFPSSVLVILKSPDCEPMADTAREKDSASLPVSIAPEEKVMALFKTRAEITRRDVELILHSSSFPARQLLLKLLEQGRIKAIGSARATKYIRATDTI